MLSLTLLYVRGWLCNYRATCAPQVHLVVETTSENLLGCLQTPWLSNVSGFGTMGKCLPQVNDTDVLIIFVYPVVPLRVLDQLLWYSER